MENERSSAGFRPVNLGAWGEASAAVYLSHIGYDILEANYRLGRLQADLIARHQGVLVLVEVKTRYRPAPSIPVLPGRKQKVHLHRILNAYARRIRWSGECALEWVFVIIDPPFINFEHQVGF